MWYVVVLVVVGGGGCCSEKVVGGYAEFRGKKTRPPRAIILQEMKKQREMLFRRRRVSGRESKFEIAGASVSVDEVEVRDDEGKSRPNCSSAVKKLTRGGHSVTGGTTTLSWELCVKASVLVQVPTCCFASAGRGPFLVPSPDCYCTIMFRL